MVTNISEILSVALAAPANFKGVLMSSSRTRHRNPGRTSDRSLGVQNEIQQREPEIYNTDGAGFINPKRFDLVCLCDSTRLWRL